MPRKPRKPPERPWSSMGPLAKTIAEIERGPRCAKCGASVRQSGHECRK